MRLEAGLVVEEIDLGPGDSVLATYARHDDGWLAEFTVRAPEVDDLAVVHRLTAPTLAAARRAVPPAAAYLAGRPVATGR